LPTDEELALGVQQGSKEDLNRLVERHHSPLLGFLYRMVGGDRTVAEDLVQETFLRLLRSIAQYQHPRRFKPWLYAIAVNLARDFFRTADRRHTDSVAADRLALIKDSGMMPEQYAVAQDEAQQVATAITTLPSHQREVIVLRYYEAMSLAEIGEVLGIPVGTVKSRLSLGLRHLRNWVATDNDEL
jgi:RNA polymerase sigma-70 factor (ECF subfamily)